ncbi:uncharacterized protein L201_000340 [Kwoniella dendrophila CBS 6074]|uniref:Uncharacterized protein n=1 Tax=Kwoniella dendrophila CBS 6074 TaxID=1295534 RepID=A0AAX4JKF3_9TREE
MELDPDDIHQNSLIYGDYHELGIEPEEGEMLYDVPADSPFHIAINHPSSITQEIVLTPQQIPNTKKRLRDEDDESDYTEKVYKEKKLKLDETTHIDIHLESKIPSIPSSTVTNSDSLPEKSLLNSADLLVNVDTRVGNGSQDSQDRSQNTDLQDRVINIVPLSSINAPDQRPIRPCPKDRNKQNGTNSDFVPVIPDDNSSPQPPTHTLRMDQINRSVSDNTAKKSEKIWDHSLYHDKYPSSYQNHVDSFGHLKYSGGPTALPQSTNSGSEVSRAPSKTHRSISKPNARKATPTAPKQRSTSEAVPLADRISQDGLTISQHRNPNKIPLSQNRSSSFNSVSPTTNSYMNVNLQEEIQKLERKVQSLEAKLANSQAELKKSQIQIDYVERAEVMVKILQQENTQLKEKVSHLESKDQLVEEGW